jgi:peroxiredoxin
MVFRDKLGALKANPAFDGQSAHSSALHHAIEALISAEQENRLPKTGEIAPVFTLPDPTGTPISSVTLLRHGPLVLTFYRGLWCPYCQRDLHEFEEVLPDIRSAGASVVAISHQLTSGDSRVLRRAQEIGFPVLDDTVGDIAVRFGLRWAPDDSRLIEEELGLNLFAFRGTEPWIVPMQARYVINRDGTIAFAEVAFDYSQRSKPASVLPILAQLPRPAASPGQMGGVS